MPSRVTVAALRHPRAAALLLSLVSALAASQLSRLHTEFGYRPLLGSGHPAIRNLEDFVARFGGGFPILVAWTCPPGGPCTSVFDSASLRMARAVTRRLRVLPEVRDVRSPATASLWVPTSDGLAVRRLLDEAGPTGDSAFLAGRARIDPLWEGSLLSPDGETGAILVQLVDSESRTSLAVMEAIFATLEPFEAQGFDFQLVGHAVEFVVAGRELAASAARLTPLAAAVVAVLLFALTRSWQAVVSTLAALGVALVWTFGFLGAVGWPQDSILQTLAPLVLVTGVCDAVHLLSCHASRRLARGYAAAHRERRAALEAAAAEVATPCLATTATTAGAFLSFATSDLETFVHFGIVAAFGVSSCLVACFTVLPLILLRLPSEPAAARRATRAWEEVLESLVGMAERRRTSVLGVAVLLFVLCGAGWLLHLRVDTDGYEMYGERSRVIRWIRFVEERMGRADTLEIEIGLPEGTLLEDPGTLETLQRTSDELSRIEGLGRARSVVDALAWLHRLLHGDDPAQQRIARSAAANAELLELIALQDPALLESWVSFDHRHARISVQAEFQSASRRATILGQVRDRIAAHAPESWQVTLTGPFAAGQEWVRDVQATQGRSFLAAFAVILGVVALQQRSLCWAWVAMVPTLLPVVVTLGVMGWVGISLDVGRSMIAAVVLGIGVDDTIHLLSRYRERRVAGEVPAAAMRAAVRLVGRAVVTTSLALALGFLSLLVSSWQTVASFGFFVALAILVALVADLLLLPALAPALDVPPGRRLP